MNHTDSALGRVVSRLAHPAVRWIALLALCSAYLQGGLTKVLDFQGALAEMEHFGLAPAPFFASATIALELGASLAILAGWHRWLAALALAGFTLAASFIANRFWEVPEPQQVATTNAFFEHMGLVGGFVLVAWDDLRHRGAGT
jgi:uncharacterized membrane protein YphA (DoxX/SURF4 family)